MKKSDMKEVNRIDWSEFNGPALYSPCRLENVLAELVEMSAIEDANSLGDKILNSLGNNHEGTYFPAVLKALDILIEVEKRTTDPGKRMCIEAVLNDIYYFEPDLGGYNGCTAEELKVFVTTKLYDYSDI